MTNITELLNDALGDEPPMAIAADQIVRQGKRSRRGRLAAGAAASTGVLGVAAVASAFALHSGGTSRQHTHTVSLAHLSQAANQHPAARSHAAVGRDDEVNGITTLSLPGLVERSTGTSLLDTSVSNVAATNDLDLSAALDVPGKPYLNVQVMPANTAAFESATCADLNDLSSPDSDGYTGPCTAQTLTDGSILIVRSGATTSGSFTMAQASIVRPDGSAITAENTNEEAMLTPSKRHEMIKNIVKAKENGSTYWKAHVISAKPSLDAAAMTTLVKDLAAAQH